MKGHIPRKRFGQHFLTDAGVLGAIVDAINPKPGESVIEIGPGLGALTNPLLERLGTLTVIELDRDLASRWRTRAQVNVIESDVLRVDFAALADAQTAPLRIVGNLPYNISSPILFHLLPLAHRVQDQVFMLQKEVIERMVAKPSTAAYGRLSVMLQWRYEMTNVLHVPPEAFDPPPRVDSAVVAMVPRSAPVVLSPQVLEDLMRAAFSQRRKLLRHSLGVWLKARADCPAAALAFDMQRRAEEVPVEEYLALAQLLSPP